MRTVTKILLSVAFLFVANIAVGDNEFDDEARDMAWSNATNWTNTTTGNDTFTEGENTIVGGGFTVILDTTAGLDAFDDLNDLALIEDATFNHSAGTINGSGPSWIKIGDGDGQPGTYNMSGTAQVLNQDVFALGDFGGTGVLNLSGDANITTNNGATLGGGTGSNGTVNQTGGQFNSGAWIGMSNNGGGTMTYNISGGALRSNGDFLTVGEDGESTLNVSGIAIVEANGIGMIVGRNAAGIGTLNVDGSTASITVNDLRVAIDQDLNDVGANGTIHFAPDAGGATPIISADNTDLGAAAFLTVDLTGIPNWVPSGSGDSTIDLLLIDNAAPPVGEFDGLAQGAIVPGTNGARISYMGGDDNNDVYLIGISISSGPVTVTADTLTVMPGVIAGGGLPELEESDNMYLRIFRDPIGINAVTQFVLTATSPTASPTTFDFTLEGNVVSRPNVVQRIELFDYVAGSFETVDERNANRTPNPDLTVTVSPGGDLSRFVDQTTNEIQARIRYRADIARAQFASNTDQAVWTIE